MDTRNSLKSSEIPHGCIYLLDDYPRDDTYRVTDETGYIRRMTTGDIKNAHDSVNVCNAVFRDDDFHRLDGPRGYDAHYVLENFQAYRKSLILGATSVVDTDKATTVFGESTDNLLRITEFNNVLYGGLHEYNTIEFLCKDITDGTDYDESWNVLSYTISAKTIVMRYPILLHHLMSSRFELSCDTLVVDNITESNSQGFFKTYIKALVKQVIELRGEHQINFRFKPDFVNEQIKYIRGIIKDKIEPPSGAKKHIYELYPLYYIDSGDDLYEVAVQCEALYMLGKGCIEKREACIKELRSTVKKVEKIQRDFNTYSDSDKDELRNELDGLIDNLPVLIDGCNEYIRDLTEMQQYESTGVGCHTYQIKQWEEY